MPPSNTANIIIHSHNSPHLYSSPLLIVYIFTTSRPPKGFTGYIDWIMDNHISNLILQGKMSGQLYESCIFAPGPKLRISLLLMLGAGDPAKINKKRLKLLGEYTGNVVNGLKIFHFGIYLHDLFLPHLQSSLVINELLEGIKKSLSGEIKIDLIFDNQEQQGTFTQWLKSYYEENTIL